MGTDEQQGKFLDAVKMACRVAKVLMNMVPASAASSASTLLSSVATWREDPGTHTARIIDTFKKAAEIAADHGERLAAEVKSAGLACTAGRTCLIFSKVLACQMPWVPSRSGAHLLHSRVQCSARS